MAFGVHPNLPGIRTVSQESLNEQSCPSARAMLDLRVVASICCSEAREATFVLIHVTRSHLSPFADLFMEL
jgi:hypothetical protein